MVTDTITVLLLCDTCLLRRPPTCMRPRGSVGFKPAACAEMVSARDDAISQMHAVQDPCE